MILKSNVLRHHFYLPKVHVQKAWLSTPLPFYTCIITLGTYQVLMMTKNVAFKNSLAIAPLKHTVRTKNKYSTSFLCLEQVTSEGSK